MLRIDEETGLGVALSVDGNGRFARLDPYDGAQAGAGRGVPQRGRHRRRAGRRHQLPQLRLARGPGGDVAVRRGRPRPRRRLPGAGHPGDRRQRQLLQPDRRGGDPPDPGRRRARRARRRGPAGPDGLPAADRRRRPALPARRDRRGALRLRVGLGRRTSTSAAARRRSTWPREQALGGADRRGRAGRPPSAPRTTSPTAAWPRRWSSRACAAASARGSRCRRARRLDAVRVPVQRVGRPGAGRGAARAREGVHRRCAPSTACRGRRSA